MRNMTRENLFERWLKQRSKYDTETFSQFSERIQTVSDTVTGDAEVSPASEKRDEVHGE